MDFGNCKIKVGKIDHIDYSKGRNNNQDTLKDHTLDAMRYCINDIDTIQQCATQLNLYRNMYEPHFPLTINKVIFNKPATIVIWGDGTKSVVKCCKDDYFDQEKGLAMAICKKILGDQFKNTFKEWLPEEKEETKSEPLTVDQLVAVINKIPMSFRFNTNKEEDKK